MPELPEVETMRRGLLPLLGGRITKLRQPRCLLKPILITPKLPTLRKRVLGQSIQSIDRLGKRIVLKLSSADTLVFEPRMTGLLLLGDPPNREHLRLKFEVTECQANTLLFWDRRGLGTVRLFSPKEQVTLLGRERIGPDALGATAEVLQAQFGHSHRAIKVALLDQKGIAGIGNIYASEILHLARIHPQSQCSALTRQHWSAIQQATQEVLELAITLEGSTLSDGTYRNALNQNGGYQNHHRVYNKADQQCPSCQQGKIERVVLAQRSTFFCPQCQQLVK